MPATDQCEPQVIRALQKAGWSAIHQPYSIRWDDGYVYADVKMRDHQMQQTMIVVEVKCFPNKRSYFEDFYHSIGQYLLYRSALRSIQESSELFLAVPQEVYTDFLTKHVVQMTLNDAKINIIVVDLAQEVITLWKTW